MEVQQPPPTSTAPPDRAQRIAELREKVAQHPWADRVLARAEVDEGFLDVALVWIDRQMEYLAARQRTEESAKDLEAQTALIDQLEGEIAENDRQTDPRWTEALKRHTEIREEIKHGTRSSYALGASLQQSTTHVWTMLNGASQPGDPTQAAVSRQVFDIHSANGTIMAESAQIIARRSVDQQGSQFYEVEYRDPASGEVKRSTVPESWIVPHQTSPEPASGDSAPEAPDQPDEPPNDPTESVASSSSSPAAAAVDPSVVEKQAEIEALLRQGFHPANLVVSGWDADMVSEVEERLLREVSASAPAAAEAGTAAPAQSTAAPASEISDRAAQHGARIQPDAESNTVKLVAGYIECVQGQNFMLQALSAYERSSADFRNFIASANTLDTEAISAAMTRRRDTLIAMTHPLCDTMPPLEVTLANSGASRVKLWSSESGAPNPRRDSAMSQEFREVARLLAYAEASQPNGVLRDIRGFDPKNAAHISEDSKVLGNFKSEKDIRAFGTSCRETIEYANSYSQKNAESLRDQVLGTEGALGAALQKASIYCRAIVDGQPDLDADERQVLNSETAILFGDGINRGVGGASLDKNPAAKDVSDSLRQLAALAASEPHWQDLHRAAAFLAHDGRAAHFQSFNPSRTRANSFLIEEESALKKLGGAVELAYANLEGGHRRDFWRRLAVITGRPRTGENALAAFMLVGSAIYGEHREVVAKAISEDVHAKKTGLQMNADRVDRRNLLRKQESKQKVLHVRGNFDRHTRGITGHLNDHTNSIARLITSGAHMEMGSL